MASLSEEEKRVKELETRFHSASRQFVGAVRVTGELGLYTGEEVQHAITKVQKVQNELEALKSQLNEEDARKRARRLEAKIIEFLQKNTIE